MSYNKFTKSNVSKLGFEIIRNGGGLTETMQMGVMNAIPIWDMLGITESQYELDYQYKEFVKNEEAITQLMKDSYDASLNIVKDGVIGDR
jgi:ketopantoate hydroxymethyltransferase